MFSILAKFSQLQEASPERDHSACMHAQNEERKKKLKKHLFSTLNLYNGDFLFIFLFPALVNQLKKYELS